MELVAPLILLAAGGAYVWNITRRRNLRAVGAMAKRMKALEPGRREAVQRAIADGRAVDDPADAQLALEWIELQDSGPWRRGPVDLGLDVLLLGAMVFYVVGP